MAFFAVDIGNTRLKWAQFEAPQKGARCIAHGIGFLNHVEQLLEHDWSALTPPSTMLGCSVASDAIRWQVQTYIENLWDLKASWVAPRAEQAGVKNGYSHPARLGADRWVAIIAARDHALSKNIMAPLVVVMIGTAVTIDAVDESGQFLGGFIVPGHGIMLRALENGTAALHVPTGDVCEFPKNTSDALTSGGTYAIAGAIDRMRRHVQKLTGKTPHCIMSGGAAWKMLPSLDFPVETIETLIFQGLLVLAHSNSQNQQNALSG